MTDFVKTSELVWVGPTCGTVPCPIGTPWERIFKKDNPADLAHLCEVRGVRIGFMKYLHRLSNPQDTEKVSDHRFPRISSW
jgi:hypothetical protein